MAGPVCRLRSSDRPAGRPLARGVWVLRIEDAQALVDDVRPDPAAGTLDELLDLVAVPIDEHRPVDRSVRVAADVTGPHIADDGLGIAGGKVGRRVGAAGEVERFEDLHDLPVRLLHGPSGAGGCLGVGTPQGSPTGGIARLGLDSGEEISCPSARKSVSAYGEVGMSAVSPVIGMTDLPDL